MKESLKATSLGGVLLMNEQCYPAIHCRKNINFYFAQIYLNQLIHKYKH